jgi:hypothetical protein
LEESIDPNEPVELIGSTNWIGGYPKLDSKLAQNSGTKVTGVKASDPKTLAVGNGFV